MERKFYSVREFCEITGYGDEGVKLAIREGRLPAIQPMAGRNAKVLIPAEVLEVPGYPGKSGTKDEK